MGRAWIGIVGRWLLAVTLLATAASSSASAQSTGTAANGGVANRPAAISTEAVTAPPLSSSAAAAPGSPEAIAKASLGQLPDLTKRENVAPAMQIIVLLTVLSLAPSILLMMTCFTRIIIVLSLLRQALGTQQLPPNQVMVGLALFMTFVVMGPTIGEINNRAVQPFLRTEQPISQTEAIAEALKPARRFMINQMEAAGNAADVDLFMDFAKLPRAKRWEEVPTLSLVPAYILSELKTAFLIGFKVYLPFLVIDMVISAILISMGMMMLPPAMISLPFKLLLFVLVDGWHLICASLMASFVT